MPGGLSAAQEQVIAGAECDRLDRRPAEERGLVESTPGELPAVQRYGERQVYPLGQPTRQDLTQAASQNAAELGLIIVFGALDGDSQLPTIEQRSSRAVEAW